MKKLKSICLTFLTVLMIIGGLVITPAHAQQIDERGEMETVTLASGNQVYTYTASVLNNPTPMMTPYIFVYSDKGYTSEEDALLDLQNLGLMDIAEAERGLVLMMTPANGASWSEEDADVYWEIIDQLGQSGANNRFVASFSNLIYAIAEGDGATFVHNILSQNAHRIAGVLTFGGEVDNPENLMPLPAYLVNADKKIIDFYKEINDTDKETTINENVCYYNEILNTKKVIVNESKTSEFDKSIIIDAWYSLLRKITRNVMHDVVWMDAQTREVFTLMDRIDPVESGLDFKYEQPEGHVGYYIWQPSEALNQTDEKYPLVFCVHGGNDHPVFEAECQGWVELAAKEKIILVSPNGSDSEPVQHYKDIIDYVCENYSVDTSRIYSTGISNGGCYTNYLATDYPELFAAVAPIAATPAYERVDINNFKNKLPLFTAHGTNDVLITYPMWGQDPVQNHDGKYIYRNIINGYINSITKINNIDFSVDIDSLDYVKYPFLGFGISDYITDSFTTKHGIVGHIATFEDNENIPNFKYMLLEGLNHNHYTEYASIIWDFFNDFKRNTETGASIYLGNQEGNTNKTALDIAVEVAQNVSEEELAKVVPAVVNEFKAALKEAQEVLANSSASQAQVDNSFARLANAIQMLEFLKGDKESLKGLVKDVEALNPSDYTPESWQKVEEALNNAKDVLTNENAMQEEVDTAYEELLSVFEDLEVATNKDLLIELANSVNQLDVNRYIDATWQNLVPVLEKAQGVIDDNNATQAEIDITYNELLRAYLDLRLKPSKDLLNGLINRS